MERFDFAVIGAGVVGLAAARRLSLAGASVLLLERHARHGLETSSRNSEVVHSGLYYPAGSMKARLCVAGNARLKEYCGRKGVFLRATGKLVVACAQDEKATLHQLLERGKENGVQDLEILGPADIQRRAPGVSALAALWVPSTAIVDSEELMLALREDADSAGTLFLWGAGLVGVTFGPGGYELELSNGERVRASRVVNCAGLESDVVARLAGIDVDHASLRLHWFKGEYFSLRRRLQIQTLVYPVPAKHGLGIHLTIDRQGAQRLGPNAFAVSRLDYDVDSSHADSFFEAARRYIPELKPEDLLPGTAGIRPKLTADGSFRDFVVQEESANGRPGWINLIGIESPGLTCCLTLAERVAELAALPERA